MWTNLYSDYHPIAGYLIRLFLLNILLLAVVDKYIFIRCNEINNNYDSLSIYDISTTSSGLFPNIKNLSLLDPSMLDPLRSVVDSRSLQSLPSIVRLATGRLFPWTMVTEDGITTITWFPDQNYTVNGKRYMNCPVDVDSTSYDDLFCTERYFGSARKSSSTNKSLVDGTYNIPMAPGTYTVNLYFAEIHFQQTNKRVFDVLVQGNVIQSNIDLIGLVGPSTAYVLSTTATVNGQSYNSSFPANNLRIDFTNIIEYAKINAIEIVPVDSGASLASTIIRQATLAPGIPIPKPIRINAGSNSPYIDSSGQQWLPDTYYIGGNTNQAFVPISNTNDDILYQTERFGDTFVYSIPLPVGEYEVTILLADFTYRKVQKRLFTINVEGTVLNDIDIVALTATKRWRTAISLINVVVVDDGTLNIDFTSQYFNNGMGGSVPYGPPKVSAIQVRLNALHVAHAVPGGPYFGAVINATLNQALIRLDGETSHTHGDGLELTTFQWKRGLRVIGTRLVTNVYLPVGIHKVDLRVKDDGNNEDTRSTIVTIRPFGFPIITSLTPQTGSIGGGYVVWISGSGFNYTNSDITVVFGSIELTGGSIEVVNTTTLKVLCPSASTVGPTDVYVRTPLGISDNAAEFEYEGSIPIEWESSVFYNISYPTVGRFGPDHKLYVGTRIGRLYKITMNDDYTSIVNVVVRRMSDRPTEFVILGIALDPMDNKPDPDVYFTAQKIFHKGNASSSGLAVNGKILKASGPGLEFVETIISGLPVSDYDHGLNALEFGDMGELYFCSGSNTNGGIPGQLSSSQLLKENFLSASINVAYLSHPDFDGNIRWSALDDGNMIANGIEPFGMGLRNSFGIVLHSNGNLYATDNGPNRGYGKMSIGCGANDYIADQERSDKLLLIQKGNYYGHPNRKRASYFNDPRQCIWRGYETTNISVSDYTPPLHVMSSSRNGIIEFQSNHFGGQLRGNLIISQYRATPSLSRVVVTKDANGNDFVVPQSIPLNVGSSGLDLAQAPNGNIIEMRYSNDSLAVICPKQNDTGVLIVTSVFPRRGTNAGGNRLSIFGKNLVIDQGNGIINAPSVMIGNLPCSSVIVIHPERIDCLSMPGGYGAVDVTVSKAGVSSTFENGYRYISGLLPMDFVLPKFN